MKTRDEPKKIDQIMKQLEEGVPSFFNSDEFRHYLDIQSRFYRYSASNCLLIAMQRPDATKVAGYRAWQDKFKRHVLPGEKGIVIIAPVPGRKTVEKEVTGNDGTVVKAAKEIEYLHFKPATVFDVSQTDGEPLPVLTHELTGAVSRYDDYLAACRAVSPVPIRFDDIRGRAKGYYSLATNEIVIQRGMPEEQTIKTCLHEICHAVLHNREGPEAFVSREIKETQAEAIAYVVVKAMGIDEGGDPVEGYSFPYLASWANGKETTELIASLDVIRKQSTELIKGIEEHLAMTPEAVETGPVVAEMKMSM